MTAQAPEPRWMRRALAAIWIIGIGVALALTLLGGPGRSSPRAGPGAVRSLP